MISKLDETLLEWSTYVLDTKQWWYENMIWKWAKWGAPHFNFKTVSLSGRKLYIYSPSNEGSLFFVTFMDMSTPLDLFFKWVWIAEIKTKNLTLMSNLHRSILLKINPSFGWLNDHQIFWKFIEMIYSYSPTNWTVKISFCNRKVHQIIYP